MEKREERFDAQQIREMLTEKIEDTLIITAGEVGSTNDEMKKLALQGEKRDVLFVASSQTAGRGRKGRSFFSPDGSGIYMSLLIHPALCPEECTLITPLCAVALSEAIEAVTGIRTDIKWVNDIFLSGRKIAGILTEGSFSQDKINYVIVGAGINLTAPEKGFPEEIKEVAGYLTESGAEVKNRLIAETVNGIRKYLGTVKERGFAEKYRERLFFLGDRITVISEAETYEATAVDIDSDCRLIVRTDSGDERILDSGEVSIKMNRK